MRRALIVVIINIVFVITDLWPAAATQQLRTIDLMTPESVLRWINGYRQKPDPSSVPDVVKALSRMSAFKDPESAGPYIGFIAGVIGSNPERAEELIGKMFPLPEENHWVIVRAIAYSAHPDWKHLLRVFAAAHADARRDDHQLSAQPVADAVPGRGPPDADDRAEGALVFLLRHLFRRREEEGPARGARAVAGAARHLLGLLFRERTLSAGLAHRRHAALLERRTTASSC